MAVPTVVMTIVKAMPYRGVPGEEWSNTYMLSGATPASSSAWRTLFDAVVAEEKKVYTNQTKAIRGYGYDKVPAKGDHAIWSVDLRPSSSEVLGTLTLGTGVQLAGDQASWVRWSLDRYNTYGKRVYLRKYFHNGAAVANGGDALYANYKIALETFGAFMMGGTVGGTRTIVDRLGNVPIATAASAYLTTRTLKRRSKRPPE